MRKTYSPINEWGQWRIRSNAELQELYGEQDLVAFITKDRLYDRPGGRQKKGRPWLRWLDDVEEDLREIGMGRLRTKAVDRNELKRILEEA
jgi:hypothetical protein